MQRKALLTFILSSFIFASCAPKDPNDPKFVVAKGQGFEITRADLDKERDMQLQMMGATLEQVPPELMPTIEKQVLEQVIVREVIIRAGEKNPPPDLDAKVQEQIDTIKSRYPSEREFWEDVKKNGLDPETIKKEIRQQFLADHVIQSRLDTNAVSVSDEEVKSFYDENAQLWEHPETATVEEVMMKLPQGATDAQIAEKKKELEKARKRVEKGEDFAKVAEEVSEGFEAKLNAGELAPFSKGQRHPELEKAAFGQKVNQLGPVFSTGAALHFIRVKSRTPASTDQIEDVGARISQFLAEQKKNKATRSVVDKLREEAKVEIYLPEPPAPAGMPHGGAMPPDASSAPMPPPDAVPGGGAAQ